MASTAMLLSSPACPSPVGREDFLALAAYLHAHALDLRTEIVECGHRVRSKLAVSERYSHLF